MKRITNRLKNALAALLTIATFAMGQEAMAVKKTVTYTFTAEQVSGYTNRWTLTFTPTGDQFGTSSGAKTVTITDISNTTGFSVELDDGLRLQFQKNAGQMAFIGSSAIILNYQGTENPHFTVSCTDYYIRHIKLADKNGNALYGTSITPAYTGVLDHDVDIDKYGGSGTYRQYYVSIVSGSSFGSITVSLADHPLTAPVDITGIDYNSDEGYYDIDDADALRTLAAYVNSGNNCEGLTFKQTADITLSHETAWNDDASAEHNFDGIGYDDSSNRDFSGTYDGDGHTISGIRIFRKASSVGLFGIIGKNDDATVKNLRLADTRIMGYRSVGGIVGYNYARDGHGGTISGCTVGSNVAICGYHRGINNHALDIGGIVGYNYGGAVTGCTCSALLTAADVNYANVYGGVVGNNWGSVTDCHAYGVILPNITWAGAIVGKNGWNGNAAPLSDNTYHSCIWNNYAFNIGVGLYSTSAYDNGSGDDRDNSTLIDAYEKTYNSDASTAHGGTHPNVQNLTVTLKGRTLYKDGAWNTLCLPFYTIDISSLPNSLKTGITVMELDKTTENASGNVTGFDETSGTLTLNFKTATSIERRKPYIVKWTSGDDIFEPTFTGIDGSRLGPISGYSTGAVSSTDGYVTFCGSHDPVHFNTTDKSILFLGDNNTLYYPSSDITIGAFRAYFKLLGGLTVGDPTDPSSNSVKQLVMNFGEDDATGLSDLSDQSDQSDAWYDLNGRKLAGKPTQRGIYMNNGKKVIVK